MSALEANGLTSGSAFVAEAFGEGNFQENQLNQLVRQILEANVCGVTVDVLQDPVRLLPCQHLFSATSLVTILNRKEAQPSIPELGIQAQAAMPQQCPVCRTPFSGFQKAEHEKQLIEKIVQLIELFPDVALTQENQEGLGKLRSVSVVKGSSYVMSQNDSLAQNLRQVSEADIQRRIADGVRAAVLVERGDVQRRIADANCNLLVQGICIVSLIAFCVFFGVWKESNRQYANGLQIGEENGRRKGFELGYQKGLEEVRFPSCSSVIGVQSDSFQEGLVYGALMGVAGMISLYVLSKCFKKN